MATVRLLVATVVLYGAFWVLGEFGSPILSTTVGESLLKLTVWLVPSAILVAVSWRLTPAGALRELGLMANPLAGAAVGLATAIPLLTLSVQSTLLPVSVAAAVGTAIVGPFAEEVLFRGLLFRQLVLRGGTRPLVAVVISALMFGAAHISGFFDLSHGRLGYVYDVWPYPKYLVEFGLTALGGVLFAWMTYRWNSLWPAIAVHACLNLSWQMTSGAPTITLFETTMTRLTSVTIACYLTWRFTRNRVHTGRVRLATPRTNPSPS